MSHILEYAYAGISFRQFNAQLPPFKGVTSSLLEKKG